MWRVVAGLVVLCAQVGSALGDPPVVAMVNLRYVDVPDQQRKSWRDAIIAGLEARGLGVTSDANLNYVETTSRELFACFGEDRCRSEIGKRLQATAILTGQISKEKDEWQANLTLHAVDLGFTVKSQTVHCPGCTPDTFKERLIETINDLITADRNLQRASLLVRTRPPGAAVRVDGRAVGTAELEVVVVAGTRRLSATHENHDPLEITVEVKPQERLEVDLKLPPRALHGPVAPLLPPPPRWWTLRRIAAVAMLAAGGAGVLVGIPLLATSNHCDGPAVMPCLYRNGTDSAGGAILGVGAALAVTGALVLLTAPRAVLPRATLAPVVGPRSAGLYGEVRF
jgi:hypothetical protein